MTIEEKIEKVWEAYPRKVGKKIAQQKIRKAIKDYDYELIISRTEELAKLVQRRKIETVFVPLPSTYFHQERFLHPAEDWYPQLSRKTLRTTL